MCKSIARSELSQAASCEVRGKSTELSGSVLDEI